MLFRRSSLRYVDRRSRAGRGAALHEADRRCLSHPLPLRPISAFHNCCELPSFDQIRLHRMIWLGLTLLETIESLSVRDSLVFAHRRSSRPDPTNRSQILLIFNEIAPEIQEIAASLATVRLLPKLKDIIVYFMF